MSLLDFGLIHVYMGEGKGKTSSALGLVVRMAGCGGKTAFIQFMKGWVYSEVRGLSFLPGVKLIQTGRPDYIYPGSIDPVDYAEAEKGLRAARQILQSGCYDLVILDEINVACLLDFFRLVKWLIFSGKNLSMWKLCSQEEIPPRN